MTKTRGRRFILKALTISFLWTLLWNFVVPFMSGALASLLVPNGTGL